ncbi:molybdopterin-binding protein [Salmonella enterica]|nr:molybdopterin-binding protein [Salmonella enterica]
MGREFCRGRGRYDALHRGAGLRVRFSANRYSLAIRQEVCAMMALNMLRRWLNGEDIISEHGWIDVVESLTA